MTSRYTPEEIKIRFWAKVLKKGPNDCWKWLGALNSDGYGRISINSKQIYIHRYSYQLHKGSIGDLQVLHTCDNPGCVNPNHLFLGDQLDNIIDCCNKNRNVGAIQLKILTDKQVKEIRNKYIPRIYSTYRLAEEYGVSQMTISRVINHIRGY